MNRCDFIEKIFDLYPNSFTANNRSSWRDAYSQVLPLSVDFAELYSRMLNEYSGATAPKPAWLKSNVTFKTNQKPDAPKYSTIKCKIGGSEYIFEFAYLSSEMTRAQAIESLRERIAQKGKSFEIIEEKGELQCTN